MEKKRPKEYLDVRVEITINGNVWTSLRWKKLTPKKFLKLSDMIEDIDF